MPNAPKTFSAYDALTASSIVRGLIDIDDKMCVFAYVSPDLKMFNVVKLQKLPDNEFCDSDISAANVERLLRNFCSTHFFILYIEWQSSFPLVNSYIHPNT